MKQTFQKTTKIALKKYLALHPKTSDALIADLNAKYPHPCGPWTRQKIYSFRYTHRVRRATAPKAPKEKPESDTLELAKLILSSTASRSKKESLLTGLFRGSRG